MPRDKPDDAQPSNGLCPLQRRRRRRSVCERENCLQGRAVVMVQRRTKHLNGHEDTIVKASSLHNPVHVAAGEGKEGDRQHVNIKGSILHPQRRPYITVRAAAAAATTSPPPLSIYFLNSTDIAPSTPPPPHTFRLQAKFTKKALTERLTVGRRRRRREVCSAASRFSVNETAVITRYHDDDVSPFVLRANIVQNANVVRNSVMRQFYFRTRTR